MRKLLIFSILALCAASLTGCNCCGGGMGGNRGGMFGFGRSSSSYGGDCCCDSYGETGGFISQGQCCQ